MPGPLILSVKDALIRYSEKPVFENLSFNIHQGSRIALIGKNGAGKSTLMNVITGERDLDMGERWQKFGLSIGYLKQEFLFNKDQSVFEFILEEIDAAEREINAYKVDIITSNLEIEKDKKMGQLSGGQLRRAGLARSLVEEPDILLLDEPTNHLDLQAIEWLENYLKNYRGTIMVISHDRTFLANITNQVFWLDRGKLKVCPTGFSGFEQWSAMMLDQEFRELQNRKSTVSIEVEWASRGVKARVKRNQARLEKAKQMRDQLKADQAAYRKAVQKIEFKPTANLETSSRVVAEFYNVHKHFEHKGQITPILDKFSLRIIRGDRIGILGRNGTGKTTFLRMLIGELQPDQGSVKRKKDLEFSYFDQKRRDLNPKDSLQKTLCPTGGEYVDVMGKKRHVCGYLRDFMFDPARAQDKISQLSGGQKNRLMLAKILADPKTCLILDEPTNDLDMDTLDMLEEILTAYTGTLIVVSHDRDFLDQTVTKILAFEGNGKAEIHIGGYSDYLEVKKLESQKDKPLPESKKTEIKKTIEIKSETIQNRNTKKLTYKLEHELKTLPEKIDKTEQEIKLCNEMLSDADFYTKNPQDFHDTVKKLNDLQAQLDRYELRWLEIEEMKNSV